MKPESLTAEGVDVAVDRPPETRAPSRETRDHEPLDDPGDTSAFSALVRLAVQTLAPRRVLDVGCGCGRPTLEALRAGAREVVGIDLLPTNVERTLARAHKAGVGERVTALHAGWDDVRLGRVDVGPVDLVVSNPPYVPHGQGVAVDGGPTGTAILDALVDGAAPETRGLALLFGSISDPLAVLERLTERGFAIRRVLARSVPFGRYTSAPATLLALRRLRLAGRAWFCDGPSVGGGAPHAYLTLGFVAERARNPGSDILRAGLTELFEAYQEIGPAAVPASDLSYLIAPAALIAPAPPAARRSW